MKLERRERKTTMSEMQHGLETPGDGHHGEEHRGGLGLYMTVFAALCVLTGASFFTYTEMWREHFSAHAGWALMMAVSCTKAMLVILFFMHLKYERSWKFVLTIPTAMMAAFLVLMLVPDVGLRTNHYSEERTRYAAYPDDMYPKPDPHKQAEH
jgi:cytochrome c oxidase subunit 4